MPGRRRRDGGADARARLVGDAARAGRRLAAEPQDRRAHHARLPVRHVAGLGAGLHLLLQRRLRPHDARPEAPLGAGPVGPRGLVGDLGRHRPPCRVGRPHRPGDLGRGLLLFLERRGFPEETYHTFSYSPVPDDRGGVGGMLCVVTEDTERTIGERRLRTLRELAARTTEEARSAEDACQTAARTLAENPHDLPFVLIYLLDADAGPPGWPGPRGCRKARPPPRRASIWPRRRPRAPAGRSRAVLGIGPCRGRHGPGASGSGRCRCGAWPEPPQQAVVLPMAKPGQARPAGFLVAGVSPRLVLDDGYRGFLDLLAGQIATARRQRPGLRGGAAAGRGAGRARPGQDRLLLQRQPRVPHPADAHARARSRTPWPTADEPLPPRQRERAGGRPPQRAAAAEAGQHPARLLADRGRAGSRPSTSRPTWPRFTADLASDFRSAVRAGRAWSWSSTARPCPSRSTSTATCGRRSS